jgi:AcrR family transcriptional regulator
MSYHHGNLREALLERAAEVLVKEGMEKVTFRGLARDLGVSHAAPRRHFPTKKSLVLALCDALEVAYEEGAIEVYENSDGGCSGVLEVVDWIIEQFNKPDAILWMILAQLSANDLEFRLTRDRIYSSHQEALRRIIADASDISAGRADAVATSTMALLDGFALRNFPFDPSSEFIRLQIRTIKATISHLLTTTKKSFPDDYS